MNFKVIYLPRFETEVLIRREVDSDGISGVMVSTVITTNEDQEIWNEEWEEIEKSWNAQAFVKGFSGKDAERFVLDTATEQDVTLKVFKE